MSSVWLGCHKCLICLEFKALAPGTQQRQEDATRWLTHLRRPPFLANGVSDSGRIADTCTELEYGIPQTTQTHVLGGDPSEPIDPKGHPRPVHQPPRAYAPKLSHCTLVFDQCAPCLKHFRRISGNSSLRSLRSTFHGECALGFLTQGNVVTVNVKEKAS